MIYHAFWHPRVGMEVRIKLSPECNAPLVKGSIATQTAQRQPHDPRENDAIGKVMQVQDDPDVPGHPYIVVFAPQYRWSMILDDGRHVKIIYNAYAANELEPADPIERDQVLKELTR